MMTREELIKTLAPFRKGIPAISGPGISSRYLWMHGHEQASIYQMDMGYATSMSLGVALATPKQKVLAVEGDGSITTALGVFTTISKYKPENLIVCIVDNEVHASAGLGEVETASGHGVSISEIAKSCGIDSEKTTTVYSIVEAEEAFQKAFNNPGPWVIVGKVDKSDLSFKRSPENTPPDIVETGINFRRAMINKGYLN